jgi:hypothetical protein
MTYAVPETRMFLAQVGTSRHKRSQAPSHSIVSLEPRFVSREPCSFHKVPKLKSKTRFQIDKRGKVGLLPGVG